VVSSAIRRGTIMKTVALALVAGLSIPLASAAQELVDVRFDRVHLRNGNVVDGHIVDRNPSSVTVKVNGGEIIFKFLSISWIEKVKMKSLKDSSIVVDKPLKEFEVAGTKGKLKITDYADLERDVLRLVNRWRTAPAEGKYAVVKEIFPLGPEAGVVLMKNLQNFDPLELQHLVEPVVLEVRPANTAPLVVPLLSNPKAALRAAGLSLLGAIGEAVAVMQVEELLKDEDPAVRGAAIVTLCRVNAKDSIEPILRLALDPEQSVRVTALNVVIDMCAKNEREVLPLLANLLDQSKGETKADIAMAVGRTKKAEAVPMLVRLLADEAASVRSMAIHTLSVMGAKEAGEDVFNRMELEKEVPVRVYLAAAVDKLHIRKGISTLIQWLADSEEGIRTSSLTALKNMTRQNLGPEPAAWQAWWDKAKGTD
jgi:HEAT repeat protein